MTRILNAQRLGLLCWSWLLCVDPHMCAQTPSDAGSPDLPKVRRYLSLEMYSEAAAALDSAVKANEFNGELRLLYGSALQGLKKYDDAISNFRLSLRLDKSRWEAAEHLVQCYQEKYAQSSANQDRVLLGEAATQLASLSPDSDTDSERSGNLREAQRRAQTLLTVLNSPVGTWRDGSLQLSVRRNADVDGTFDIHTTMGNKDYISGSFRRLPSGTFSGSAIYSTSPCAFDIEVTLQLLDSGTKLLLQEQSAKYKGPHLWRDPAEPTQAASDLELLRARDKVCKFMVRTEVQRTNGRDSNPNYPLKLSLERVQ